MSGGIRVATQVICPALLSTAAHICFAALLLEKWLGFESETGETSVSSVLSVPADADIGPSWAVVFCPSWAADCITIFMAVVAMLRNSSLPRNPRLIQLNSVGQASCGAAFKLMLVARLQ